MKMTNPNDRVTSLSVALRVDCPAIFRRGVACNEVRVEETRPGDGAGFTYCGTPFYLRVKTTRRLRFDGSDLQLHLLSVSEGHTARVLVYAPRSVRVIRPYRDKETDTDTDTKGVA